ncbi:hypothetical protein Ais01nite_76220 [Asanoa ishikariensis]|uniref:Uncharacterized protein n=1 Tax=Asanoa ishikariensis TaxID=137265 RepID=A0A1H3L047_9ACTN|nr:hypothetical protein [Asanoa ishikariensis]GIF69587.1 hypothetical protein Ais01nite_76220 [Asanoa ishikariensis]SDY57636.1 hypothetical protein SAMN05421684_0448 [Asanoa ishikariensis]
MSTVTALSTLAKGTSATPVIVAVLAFMMIAAFLFFRQFGEVIAHAVQLLRIAITALFTATLLVGVAVVMVVVAVRA